MKSALLLLIVIFLLSISLPSCNKEVQELTQIQKEQNAINEIRKVVGDGISIIKINVKLDGSKKSNIESSSLKDTTTLKMLTLEEFKLLYKDLAKSSILTKIPEFDSLSETRKLEIDDGPGRPGRAGEHTQSFYLPYMLSGSSPRSILESLNIIYQTDINGRVIGSPAIYFTGLNLFSWMQVTNNPIINFNQNTFTSTFNITGTTLYGISFYGLNLGVTLGINYKIVVHMDSMWGQDGWVDIVQETEGIK